MVEAAPRSHLVPGIRREQIRLEPTTRDGVPVVQLDVLQPLVSHATALTVIGRPVLIPSGQIPALREALARLAEDPPHIAPEDLF